MCRINQDIRNLVRTFILIKKIKILKIILLHQVNYKTVDGGGWMDGAWE
jgi:hypothetical protein